VVTTMVRLLGATSIRSEVRRESNRLFRVNTGL
jgi:hypothetical protein